MEWGKSHRSVGEHQRRTNVRSGTKRIDDDDDHDDFKSLKNDQSLSHFSSDTCN